jgi:hypothetical protein
MKFALINGQRSEAKSGYSGECIGCGKPVLAKCGEVRIPHWAHRSAHRCDSWWENETEWHRSWKNQFPVEWQEITHRAIDGELHIADVKTEEGWVLEFQHSFIKSDERFSRERFYKKLIWVVDGKRRLRDEKQFFSVLHNRNKNGSWVNNSIYPELHPLKPEGSIFQDWIESTAHVFFDFGGVDLWWLLPQSDQSWALILPITRRQFMDFHQKNDSISPSKFDTFFKKYNISIPNNRR